MSAFLTHLETRSGRLPDAPGSGRIIDIAAELETLVGPLAGSTQGEAVKFVLRLLTEQPALANRIRRLEENLEGWRQVAGHYCTCLGKEPHCRPCLLEADFRALMRSPNAEVCDGGRKASESKQDANRHSQH